MFFFKIKFLVQKINLAQVYKKIPTLPLIIIYEIFLNDIYGMILQLEVYLFFYTNNTIRQLLLHQIFTITILANNYVYYNCYCYFNKQLLIELQLTYVVRGLFAPVTFRKRERLQLTFIQSWLFEGECYLRTWTALTFS